MICVLRVVEGPATGMKCWLKSDQRITIGRVSTSDFSIGADQHMSRTHMVVEGSEVAFRIRDTGSSNGTYVNDHRITIFELCDGDRIRAGTTVFQVDFEEVQGGRQDRPVPVNMPLETFSIPRRTLSTESLEYLDNDETKRFSVAPLQDSLVPTALLQNSLLQATLRPDATLQPAPEVAVSVKEGTANPAKVESEGPVLLGVAATTFLNEFPVRVGKSLWKQSADKRRTPLQIIDRLSLIEWDAKLSLVVNRSQIDDADCNSLDFSVSKGESRRLTETLYLLQNKSQPAVLEFYRHCLNRDAAICIASPNPLNDKWILDSIDALSYPSMLFELVTQSQDRAIKLINNTYFLMFETNNQNEICLLRSE